MQSKMFFCCSLKKIIRISFEHGNVVDLSPLVAKTHWNAEAATGGKHGQTQL